MNKAKAEAAAKAAEIEAALKDLSPRDKGLVELVLENHPSLSIEEALEILKFGGL